jgi:uncharacterized protein
MKFGFQDSVIEKIHCVFQAYSSVSEAVLYGSRAKGNFKIGSDIDLVLKGNGLTVATLNQIANDLDDLLLPYKFDLSIYDHIKNADLLEHINRVGIVFFKSS